MTRLPTPRQRETIRLAGQGLKNREIAIKMGLSESAVIHSLVRSFETLGVHTRQEACQRLTELEAGLPTT